MHTRLTLTNITKVILSEHSVGIKVHFPKQLTPEIKPGISKDMVTQSSYHYTMTVVLDEIK